MMSRIRGAGNKGTELQPSHRATADREVDSDFPGEWHYGLATGLRDQRTEDGAQTTEEAVLSPARLCLL